MKYSLRTSSWFLAGLISPPISALFWLIVFASVVAGVKMKGSRSYRNYSSVLFPSEQAFLACGTAKEDTGEKYFFEGKLT
jgi:hypothetical protein